MRCTGFGVLSVVRSLRPLRSLEPWVHWIPPDLHGFDKWVLDALRLLDDFVRQVVVVRWHSGLRCWANWLLEDLGSRPCAILCLPLPFLSSEIRWPRLLRSWLRLTSLMPSFVRHGCRFSADLVIRWLRLSNSCNMLTPFFLRSLFWTCPGLLSGQDL